MSLSEQRLSDSQLYKLFLSHPQVHNHSPNSWACHSWMQVCFLTSFIGLPRLVLSAGAGAVPNPTIQEFMPGSLRWRTGSRGQHLGLRTVTVVIRQLQLKQLMLQPLRPLQLLLLQLVLQQLVPPQLVLLQLVPQHLVHLQLQLQQVVLKQLQLQQQVWIKSFDNDILPACFTFSQ